MRQLGSKEDLEFLRKKCCEQEISLYIGLFLSLTVLCSRIRNIDIIVRTECFFLCAEIAACCRLLARLNYIMGDYGEALVFQQRAVLMSERVLGIDHPNTITEYVSA